MSEANQTKNIPPDKLVRVTFLPEGTTVEFEFGTMPYDHHGKPMSFLDVAENFGIFLDHACGGVCACTTCHLWIKDRRGHQRSRRRRTRPARHGRRSAAEFAPGLPGRHHHAPATTWSRFPSGTATTSPKASRWPWPNRNSKEVWAAGSFRVSAVAAGKDGAVQTSTRKFGPNLQRFRFCSGREV